MSSVISACEVVVSRGTFSFVGCVLNNPKPVIEEQLELADIEPVVKCNPGELRAPIGVGDVISLCNL